MALAQVINNMSEKYFSQLFGKDKANKRTKTHDIIFTLPMFKKKCIKHATIDILTLSRFSLCAPTIPELTCAN